MSSRVVATAIWLTVLALSGQARADAGALTLELGGGASLPTVRAPYAAAATEPGTSWLVTAGGFYSLSNRYEVGFQLFYEPPQQFVHNGAAITNDAGTFQGSLVERTQRYGGVVRARRVFGLVWQPVVALDIGWSHRTFTRVDLFDVRDGTARSYGLKLPDASQDALLLAPGFGLRWSDDHFAIGVHPRVEMLVGSQFSWAVSIPLTIAWAWYL